LNFELKQALGLIFLKNLMKVKIRGYIKLIIGLLLFIETLEILCLNLSKDITIIGFFIGLIIVILMVIWGIKDIRRGRAKSQEQGVAH